MKADFHIMSMNQNSSWPFSNGQIIYQTVSPQPQQTMDYFWTANVNSVLCLPPYQEMRVSKFGATHPLQAGFVRTFIEESKNQLADYRKTLPDGRGIHIREFSDCYVIHWDKICPLAKPIEHIQQDAPQYVPLLEAGIIFGALGAIVTVASLFDS
jgi:hypothetical protein